MAAEEHTADRQRGPARAPSPDPFPALLGLARRSVLVAGVIGLAAVCVTALALWQLRQHQIEASVRNLLHVSRGLAEQTSREILEADQDLLRIVEAARSRPGMLDDREHREGVMMRNLNSITQAAAMTYVDRSGTRHVYAKPRSAAAGSLPDPPRVRTQGLAIRDGSDRARPGLFLERTVSLEGAASPEALVVTLSEDFLENLYRTWRGESQVRITLTTLERRTLVQFPVAPELAGKPLAALSGNPVERLLDDAVARYIDPVEGRPYLMASQAVPGFNLVVHASVSEDAALAEWTRQSALVAGAVFVLVLSALLLARRHAAELGRRATAVSQLQALQTALSAEEGKLQAIFNTVLDSIIVIDERGTIERVNAATEKMFGYASEALIGQNVAMLLPAPQRTPDHTGLARGLGTAPASLIGSARELTVCRSDGTEFPVHLDIVEQHHDRFRHFTATIRDITRSRLADAVLRTESRIATLPSHARTPEDVAGQVVAALCDLGFSYGHWVTHDPVTREWDVRARLPASAFTPGHAASLEPAGIACGDEGVTSAAWRTGEIRWRLNVRMQSDVRRRAAALAAGLNSWVALPIRSAGEVVAVVELFSMQPDPRNETLDGALHNISLQVGHLLTRLDAEQQLEKIVRTVPSAVFQARVGERGTIALSFMSAQIETLWGVPAQMALRHSRRVLWKIARAHRRQLLQGLSEAVLQGSGWDVTVPIQMPQSSGGTLRWLRIHAAPDEQDGAARTWDGIISDVTEQKLAERQIVLLNLDLERRVDERTQELAALNQELEAFTASVSHDLRAPLRGMRSYADLLKASPVPLPQDALALLERIIEQGAHMEQLIEALLELAHLSRADLRHVGTDMSDIATSTLRELQSRDASRNVRWSVEAGMTAYADPRLIRIVFENLLANAWKFTRDRAQARIEVGTAAGTSSTFFVRDNGAGFDPAFAERLFQPFQRLHPASRFEGTGIGLATVHRIVRRHGGRIWWESQPEEGATFFFELPIEPRVNYTRGA